MYRYVTSLVLLFLSSLSFANEIVVEHFKGTLKLDHTPKRVVAIGYGVVDALDQFGIKPVAVANATHLPHYLQQYGQASYPSAGSHFEPDFESIYSQKPDLIIVGPRAATKYDELSKIAPTLVFTANLKHDYWASTQAQWRNLGKVFSIERQVELKIAQLDQKITAIKAYNQQHKVDAMTLLSVGENITSFGQDSRFSAIYQDFGFVETVDSLESGSHGDLVSFEFVMQSDPSIILAIDRNQLDASSNHDMADILDNDLVKQTRAFKNSQIAMLDVDAWYLSIAGVSATEKMVEDIQQVLKL
ncbi:enterochelin ABC transporter substrate-binding protein [Vibrio panuliri]|uniref:Enterochelin ABC transporter substrate-binding protein n=1 Tax=Vibrio panuliri TaxID=1381081 RepID=A0A1Q9HK40_9VIBR|nr:ABC transporter substrate-binding protein [Vibrio panuliri]OLQ90671.1 enterochelin ABC transporter substrate-binding protein [Vibrio panuliri]